MLECHGKHNTVHMVQGVCDVAWTLRGHLLASASDDKTLRLWDGDTGACVRLLEGHTNFVFCCNFNPSGNYLVRRACNRMLKRRRVCSQHRTCARLVLLRVRWPHKSGCRDATDTRCETV